MYSASKMLAKARGNSFTCGGNKESYRLYYRNVYLKSDHWKLLREEKLNISPCCEICGSSLSLDVHHKEYRGLYDVKVKDLQTLCRVCHDKTHAKIEKRKHNKKHKAQKRIDAKARRLEIMRRDPRKVAKALRIYYKYENLRNHLSPKNRKRKLNFDKKYLFREMNTYVSIHY